MLILTIVITCLTLIERRFLALVQRRVGPNFVDYKSRLQYIAYASKLFIKGSLIPDKSNNFFFICYITEYHICYLLFFLNEWCLRT